MALMLGKLYDALRDAQIPESKAREAAEEVAAYERDIAVLRTELRVVQALGGITTVLLLGVLWQLVTLSSTVGRIDERLGGVEQRLGGIEARLGGAEQRLGGIESRLPAQGR